MASNPELALITKLLNLEGTKVKNYRLIEGIGIFIYLKSRTKKVTCPHCGQSTDKLHQNQEYTVRDLPLIEQKVYLKVNRRRLKCPHCSRQFNEELEWLKKNRTYTERFKNKIIHEVLESDVKNVARRYGFSEQEVATMLKEHGEELYQQKPKEITKLGIDEIALVKGQKNYCAVLVDLEKKVIVGLLPKRTEEEVTKYLEAWGEEVLGQIQEVSIDLWKPYKTVVEKLMPQAEIVADRFHVMKQVNDELDRARRKVKREAKKIKNQSKREKLIKGVTNSKYVLLKNESELTEKEREKLEEVKQVAPELGKMHQLKEEFRQVFEKKEDWGEGLLNFSDWLKKAFLLFPKSSQTIRRWIGEIIAYFDQRTSQGIVEGINNKIKLIKRRAYGFRNFTNFQIRCFLNWYFTG